MSLWSRIGNTFRAGRLTRELDEEIQSHIEEAIEHGRDPAEARRAFGPTLLRREESRDIRLMAWLDSVLRDFRYGLSSLRREPGFAAAAIGVLALGIGANTAMFSIVDAVLLKPLPFPEPQRMVRVWEAPTPVTRNETTTLTFLDWKRQSAIFEALSVESPARATVETGGNPVRLTGELVSADYFTVFGVTPRMGRAFAPDEDQPGRAPVVVISDALWQSRFGGDPAVLNRDLKLDGVPHRIIGVLPPGAFDRGEAVFWKPLIFAPEQRNRVQHLWSVVGRLRAGVTDGQAQAAMNLLRAGLGKELADYKDWGFAVDPFTRSLVADTLRRSIWLAFGAVVMVLLIACANAANLALARGAARQKEFAVRAALGAGRGRLLAQLLTESLVLCLLGGLAGVAVAYALLHAAAPLVFASLPFTADPRLDLRVLGAAALAVMAVLILCGLLPSLRMSFGGLAASLNRASRGTSRSGAAVRRTVVVGEVAVSVMLLCGAALLFKSLVKLQQVEAGVRIDHVMTMSTNLPPAAYPSPESAVRFYDALVQHLRSVPGVSQATVTHRLPLQGAGWGEGMNISGQAEFFGVGVKPVDPRYFTTMRIPLESGRGIEDRDRAGAPPVLIVNQELAQYVAAKFGIADPVGRIARIALPGYGPIPESLVKAQIVGVIRSEHTSELEQPQQRIAYVPLAQVPQQDINLAVLTRVDPLALMPDIREAVRQVDPNLALADVRTMEQVKQRSMLWAMEPTWVMAAFAGVSALLAALGLYGVLAHAVTQQRREIGIRMALGAQPRNVLSHVIRGAFSMILLGLAGGMAGALALTRLLRSLLFQVSALDAVAL
ncbi:MAG TPA: ABC transporter permease, partial [Bryobacteraceae bacterium]|nr:ABC transporter permease [Bryobacteraceae bacterium]